MQTSTPLKTTSSLCPVCKQQIPAEVFEADSKIYLRKHCPQHGPFEVLINSDARFYYDSRGSAPGSPGSACCGSSCSCHETPPDHEDGDLHILASPTTSPPPPPRAHNPDLIEKASTCIALIEIVDSCNLKCPTCYADSPYTDPDSVQALPLEEFHSRLESVLQRKGAIDILQLSGGEPTLHPRFFELIESVLSDPRIGYTLLNTNGLRLARDEVFMDRLGALRKQYSRIEIYLQYDGPQEQGQSALRGADLRRVRQQAVQACEEHDIAVSLAMTVNDDNCPHLGDAVRWGLSQRTVRGITFQPMFHSGRTPRKLPTRPVADQGPGNEPRIPLTIAQSDVDADTTPPPPHLNVADLIRALIDQSDGLITEQDFTPLPCGDPNCHTVGYLLRHDDQVTGVSRLVDFSSLQGFLKDRLNFNLEDLSRCGCESQPLGQILKNLEIGPHQVFRLFIKPFMDAWTYDQDRIDRCCVHVIGPAGRLESFCRHYAMRT